MQELISFIQARLHEEADPSKSGPMAAYMKTNMPFHGVQKPVRTRILREAIKLYPIESHTSYSKVITSLWALPHREEKYLAIQLAIACSDHIVYSQVPLYRLLIVEGAWWDFVDDVAIRLIGTVWLNDRQRMNEKLDAWIDHSDMWLRRTALIGQIKHKDKTDTGRLFDFCLRRVHEREFFIRKAIGWALREHAKTNPIAVRQFLVKHREQLSPLSFREASRHLHIN